MIMPPWTTATTSASHSRAASRALRKASLSPRWCAWKDSSSRSSTRTERRFCSRSAIAFPRFPFLVAGAGGGHVAGNPGRGVKGLLECPGGCRGVLQVHLGGGDRQGGLAFVVAFDDPDPSGCVLGGQPAGQRLQQLWQPGRRGGQVPDEPVSVARELQRLI